MLLRYMFEKKTIEMKSSRGNHRSDSGGRFLYAQLAMFGSE